MRLMLFSHEKSFTPSSVSGFFTRDTVDKTPFALLTKHGLQHIIDKNAFACEERFARPQTTVM